MTAFKKVEEVFPKMQSALQVLQKATDLSYLECFAIFGEALVTQGKIAGDEFKLTDEQVAQLTASQQALTQAGLTPEQWRILVQLVLLQSYQVEKIQANHQITPDSIGYLVAYLLKHLCVTDDHVENLTDLTVGSANLLTTVAGYLKQAGVKVKHLNGIDNDDLMLEIAAVNAGLQRVDVDLYHQDALGQWVINASDIIIGDLPVGYYPLDERVEQFKTKAKKGHSYVHHLLIEQALQNLRPAGWGVFLVPSNLFTTPEANSLVKTIQELGHFQGLLQLPAGLFTQQAGQKSLLLVQKQGKNTKQAGKVLLGTLPAIKDQQAWQRFLAELAQWKQTNLA